MKLPVVFSFPGKYIRLTRQFQEQDITAKSFYQISPLINKSV